MLYGIEIVGLANTNKLESIYNKIVRIASGVYPTTPTDSVLVEAGCLPFGHKAALTLSSRAAGIIEKSHKSRVSVLQEATDGIRLLTGVSIPQICKLYRNHDRMWLERKPSIDWSVKRKYKVGDAPVIAKQLFTGLVRTKYANHTHIYVDGSVGGNQTGFAVVGENISFERQLPPECSIFTAEAAALAKAVLIAPRNKPTIIVSDSASCLEAVQKGTLKHPFIQEIDKNLGSKKITFIWVPGHVSIPGNEAADVAAKRGRTKRLLKEGTPKEDIMKWLKKLVHLKFDNDWNRQSEENQLRRIKTNTIRWSDRLNRMEQKCLTRCRTGHSRLTKEHVLNKKPIPICSFCQKEISIEHILVECSQLKTIRDKVGLDKSIKNVLKNDKISEGKLLAFLRRAKLFELI